MLTYCVKRENDHCNEIIESKLTFEQAQLVRSDHPGSWIEEDEDFYVNMED